MHPGYYSDDYYFSQADVTPGNPSGNFGYYSSFSPTPSGSGSETQNKISL